MPSAESQTRSETVEVGDARLGMDSSTMKNNGESVANKKKKMRISSFVPRFGCFRPDHDWATVERPDNGGSFDMESAPAAPNPTHLVIMVNGIIGRLVSDSVFVKCESGYVNRGVVGKC